MKDPAFFSKILV
jgi:myosin heavy subunit